MKQKLLLFLCLGMLVGCSGLKKDENGLVIFDNSLDISQVFLEDVLNEDYENMLTYVDSSQSLLDMSETQLKQYLHEDETVDMEDFFGNDINAKDVEINIEEVDDNVIAQYRYNDKTNNEQMIGEASFIKENDRYFLDVKDIYRKDSYLSIPKGAKLYINNNEIKTSSLENGYYEKYKLTGLTKYDYDIKVLMSVDGNEYKKEFSISDVAGLDENGFDVTVKIGLNQNETSNVLSDYKNMLQNIYTDILAGKSYKDISTEYFDENMSDTEKENIYNGFKSSCEGHTVQTHISNISINETLPWIEADEMNPTASYVNSDGMMTLNVGLSMSWKIDIAGYKTTKTMTKNQLGVVVKYDESKMKITSGCSDDIYWLNNFSHEKIK